MAGVARRGIDWALSTVTTEILKPFWRAKRKEYLMPKNLLPSIVLYVETIVQGGTSIAFQIIILAAAAPIRIVIKKPVIDQQEEQENCRRFQ